MKKKEENNSKKDVVKIKKFFCNGKSGDRINRLKRSGKEFEVRRTGRSVSIKVDNLRYIYCGSVGLPFTELNLQKRFRDDIVKNLSLIHI